MLYRHERIHEPGVISDVFDSIHYRQLCQTHVHVDGKQLEHKFFSNKHDIAFSMCHDGFLLYNRRRRGPSATPIVIQNYNLPPEVRTQLGNLIPSGVIPGPHGPKEPGSFLVPMDDECAQLAHGVRTFNAISRDSFILRAYNIFDLGDIVAIERLLGLKGHNRFSPCRSCEIKGVRDVTGKGKIYYVPLVKPRIQGQSLESWDPYNLPMRKPEQWAKVLAKMEAAPNPAHANKIAMHFGIKRSPGLTRVNSLHYPRSFPWDWMHEFLENTVPNLFNFWTGRFKMLDTGSEDYEIAPHIWVEIGRETAEAVKHIPAAFVRVLGNIANGEDRSNFTAESWSFWFIYLAPILLQNRFPRPKYYTHMCDLVNVMKLMLQFSITTAEIDNLQSNVISWVQRYERCVVLVYILEHIIK
jgi:hypothetical protein